MDELDAGIDIFPWDERFATGIEIVDDQHRRLVAVLNELATAVAFERGREALESVFDALVAYAGYHFETEEAVWADALGDDAETQGHRRTHAGFVEQVLALRRQTASAAAHHATTEDVLEFLVRWLAGHILESDRYMAQVVLARRDGLSLEAARDRARDAIGGEHRIVVDMILTIYGTLTRNTLRLMRQIAAHREKDARLERSERRFRLLFELLPLGVCLTDPEGRPLEHNLRAAQLLGPEAEALRPEGGRWRLHAPRGGSLPADDLPPSEAARLGRPIEGRILRAETPEGTRWLSFTSAPIAEPEPGALTVVTDITRLRQAEERLRQSASVFEHASEGIMITAPDGTVVDVNRAFERITGRRREAAIGQRLSLPSSGRHDPELHAELWRALQQTGRWQGEVSARHEDGSRRAVLQTVGAVLDDDGAPTHYVALLSDITDLKDHQARLEFVARRDALTHLPNRSLLVDRLRQDMARAKRDGGVVAVTYLDLDGFKEINDAHGSEVGDAVLRAVADRLRTVLRSGDTLGRLGGDEFVAVLTDLASPSASAAVVEHLLQAAAMPIEVEGRTLGSSASAGVALFPQAEDVDADQLLRQADQAMYQAKQAGKRRLAFFDPELERAVRGRHRELEAIREGLDADRFVLHYQPKVRLATGELVGVEALVRWDHPERGLLPPAAFLPALRGDPLTVALGDRVLEQALAQAAAWSRAGRPLEINVNVDAAQLEHEDFVPRLEALLARHPELDPSRLELEILETSALGDLTRAVEVMRHCRALGVRFALDDFGTGYSSLTHLRRLPVDTVKIDKSFVLDMFEDAEDLTIVDGLIRLADSFQLAVVAEGVETIESGALLAGLGCSTAQGYAIARPMPAEELETWAAAWSPPESWLRAERLSPESRAFLVARVENRGSVRAVRAYARDGGPPPAVPDERQCRLGRWLAASDRGSMRTAGLEQLHLDFHRAAAAILEGAPDADLEAFERSAAALQARLGGPSAPLDPASRRGARISAPRGSSARARPASSAAPPSPSCSPRPGRCRRRGARAGRSARGDRCRTGGQRAGRRARRAPGPCPDRAPRPGSTGGRRARPWSAPRGRPASRRAGRDPRARP